MAEKVGDCVKVKSPSYPGTLKNPREGRIQEIERTKSGKILFKVVFKFRKGLAIPALLPREDLIFCEECPHNWSIDEDFNLREA